MFSSRYFFFLARQFNSKKLCGKFPIPLSLHTKLVLLLSRPTAVEQNCWKAIFISGNKFIVEGKKIVWESFELAWGLPESEISRFLVFQLFPRFHHLYFACYNYHNHYSSLKWLSELPMVQCGWLFLCPREMARLHSIVRELRMPLFNREDMVQLSFSQSFVTVVEVVAGDDVSISDISFSSKIFY